jgi:predicted nucleic acid-binding protein
MLRILREDFGSPIIVDYVILETLLLLNVRKLSYLIESLYDFLRSNKFKIFFVTEEVFNDAMKLTIEKRQRNFLSLTDSSEIVVSGKLDSHVIATFDGLLGNFFERQIGEGCFDQLDEKEKHVLLKQRSR